MTTPRSERPEMAAYGVPDALEGVLPWSWAEERLSACRNFWVVSVAPDGRPHAMPVWGIWLPDPGTFTFSCAPTSRKARNFATNPQATVAVDHTVEVVVVEGTVSPVDPVEADEALTAYVAKYWDTEPERDEGKAFVGQNLVLELTPERAFGIIEDEVDFSQRATRWVW